MLSKKIVIIDDIKLALDKCPKLILVIFVLSTVLMNVFANKSVAFQSNFLALDCGVLCSGITCLCMDVLTKLYGHKCTNLIMLFVVFCSIVVAILFFIVAYVPGYWSTSTLSTNSDEVNIALNNILRGNGFVLFGSILAFLISGCINNFLNSSFGKIIHDVGKKFSKFAFRSFLSTFISQMIDNLIFSFIVSRRLFGWSLSQCLSCSILTAIIELLFEVIFSPFGYFLIKSEKS